MEVPISETEMLDVSFLAHRFGLQYHGMMAGAVILAFGVMQLATRRILPGLLFLVVGCYVSLATSEVHALRQGLLSGDMRIGCYVYESMECRKMLDLPVGDTKSIYKAGERGRGGRPEYADWYAPLRDQLKASVGIAFPSTLPGVALLKSPISLFRLDEMKATLEAQRQELANFRASLPPAATTK
ncbi:hypothetical protein DENIT_20117 [Pseudomonas veronii]|nr:hypothetical protein DENIT_20117 [Pseudomonas veronii]